MREKNESKEKRETGGGDAKRVIANQKKCSQSGVEQNRENQSGAEQRLYVYMYIQRSVNEAENEKQKYTTRADAGSTQSTLYTSNTLVYSNLDQVPDSCLPICL